MPEKQVDKKAYEFSRYCPPERWASYWHQIDNIVKLNPNEVLEIGVGDGVVGDYIKKNTGIGYTSLDIAADLKPDALGSIEKIPFPDGSFDLVCAFEVLEHLPYEKFASALGEMRRVSRKFILISLPHWGRHISFDIRLPFFKRLRASAKISFPAPPHDFKGEHYWEIGKRGFPLSKIKRDMVKNGVAIIEDHILFDSPYHHIFIMSKADS